MGQRDRSPYHVGTIRAHFEAERHREAQPFTTVLGASNLPWLRYEWIWEKSNVSNYLNAHHQPMRQHETVLVFSPKPKATYNAQGLIAVQKTIKQAVNSTTNYGKHGGTIEQEWTNWPTTLLEIESRTTKTHPTEKPVELMEYLVRTHSNPGDMVLDNCMGSGTTGIACINSGRDFIGYELDPTYFAMAQDRIENHVYKKTDKLADLFDYDDEETAA